MTLLSPKSLSFLIIAAILTTIFSNLSITWAFGSTYDPYEEAYQAEQFRRAREQLDYEKKRHDELAHRSWQKGQWAEGYIYPRRP